MSAIEAAAFIITAAQIIAFSTPPSPAIRHSSAAVLFLSGTTLFVANTTISGNSVTPSGSAAVGVFISGGSAATFRNSTISNNTGAGGGSGPGGVQVNGTLNFGNTIIAGSSAPGFPDILNFGGATSAGNNFVGNTSTNTAIDYQPSGILNKIPMLGVLQINGGPTPTTLC